ncbi:hypothetical protein Tco_1010084 [Tanacetum coccineum]
MVEHGVPSLPTLPFITSSVTALPLDEGGYHTDSVTGPSLRAIGPSTRFVVLSDSSHHSSAKSADPEVDSLVRSAVPVMTEATTVTTIATTVGNSTDYGKDKDVRRNRHVIWVLPSSSEKTDRTLSLFTRRSGSGFASGEYSCGGGYRCWFGGNLCPECTVTKGFELNDGHLVPIYDISLLWGSPTSVSISSLEATEGSLRGEVASAKEHNGLLKSVLFFLEVHERETSSTDLCEKLEMYEGSLKRLEEFQDNIIRPLETRLAEIDADFTKYCMRFQESFHPHLLNVVAGRRWLLTHGMQLLMAKCLNSTEYMEALGHAFGRAIEKGMQDGLAIGIEHGKAGRCLTDLEAINTQPLRVEKMERNLIERLPFLKDVFVSLDHPLSAEALIEPPVEVPATNVLSTVVIVPPSGPSVSVEDYENPDLVDEFQEHPQDQKGKEYRCFNRGDLAFSKLDDEARDAVL